VGHLNSSKAEYGKVLTAKLTKKLQELAAIEAQLQELNSLGALVWSVNYHY
jgi:hypothetical protein